jgi:hypothetical protein
MEHGDALRTMASEKYLLDELTPELREEFEEHFFSCPDCALDVRAGAALIEHSKIALSEPAVLPAPVVAVGRSVGFFGWLRPAITVPALAALLVILGYLNFFPLSKTRSATGNLNVPQILPAVSLVSARGEVVPVVAVGPSQSFLLFVDVPVESRFRSYVCELHSPSGALLWSIPVSSEAAKDTLPLHVPVGQMVSGSYSLVVQGVVSGSGQDKITLARYPFELSQK